MKFSTKFFFKSSHLTISNSAPKCTLDGRMKACEIIGRKSEYFVSLLLYMAFLPLRLILLVLTQHLNYHICTLHTARGMQLAKLTSWDLVFHIRMSESI